MFLPRPNFGHSAFVAAALLAATWAAAAPARACSEPCGLGLRVPYVPSIPGNLITFDVLRPELPYSLETVGGELVPTSVRLRGGKPVFETDEPVAPGTQLRVHFTDCDAPLTHAFIAGPFVELEASTPTLELVERRVEAAGSDAAASVVRLRYRGPDSTNVAPHLIDARVSVDGRDLQFAGSEDGSIIELRSACNGRELVYGPPCSALSTPPGVYTVEVQTHIVGAEADPDTLELEVDTSCPRGALGPDDAAGCTLASVRKTRAPLALVALVGLLVLGYGRRRLRAVVASTR